MNSFFLHLAALVSDDLRVGEVYTNMDNKGFCRWFLNICVGKQFYNLGFYEISNWRRASKKDRTESDKNWRVQENIRNHYVIQRSELDPDKFQAEEVNAINMANCEDKKHILKSEFLCYVRRKKLFFSKNRVVNFCNKMSFILCNYCWEERE